LGLDKNSLGNVIDLGTIVTDVIVKGLDGLEILVLFYNNCYAGQCIESVDGVSKKVGMAFLTAEKRSWEYMLNTGQLKIQWRHVYLQ